MARLKFTDLPSKLTNGELQEILAKFPKNAKVCLVQFDGLLQEHYFDHIGSITYSRVTSSLFLVPSQDSELTEE